MARVYRETDRISLVIDEMETLQCVECKGSGFVTVVDQGVGLRREHEACGGNGFTFGKKTGEIRLKLKPMTGVEKAEIRALERYEAGVDRTDRLAKTRLAMAITIKEQTGLYLDDEKKVPYALEFGTDKRLTDKCVDDLLNITVSSELAAGCLLLIAGVPKVMDNADPNFRVRFELSDKSPNA